MVTFSFEAESPLVDASLQVIRSNIFMEDEFMIMVLASSTCRTYTTVHGMLACYNITEVE
jgi:hypothetical protein